MDKEDRLLTTREAAKVLNTTDRFLEARRVRGGGPKYVRISARAVRYRLSDLQAWIAERVFEKTSNNEGEEE